MARTHFQSVDEYIALQPESSRAVLEQVRHAIRRALPKAEETISYQIPAYKLNDAVVIYFAGWKKHYSIYPASGLLIEEFGDELAQYEISKGTIRFPLGESVPVKLIERIAKFRAKEARERKEKV
ncbi:MAG TPA: DUF1801 domain-containing protein [Alloacidobacterium sp.]|nr:DUF1801 domain-containing protein [Alloacidobacterium sp.]